MKIFNWVHKTFHHSVLKEGYAQNATKKTESTAINAVDRHALLKQVDFDHVEALHDWRDGILTIGTFGFESLKPSNEQKEYLVLESEDDDEDEEEEVQKSMVHDEDDDIIGYLKDEELNPLMFTAFGHKSHDVSAEKRKDLIIGGYDQLNMESKYSAIMEMENEEKKKKGERRITLADLFLADAGDVAKVLENDKVLQKKTADVRSKSSLSFAKKLIPRVKEDSHPIKNFQRLMRRMLKRKIHPEIEDKISKASADLTCQIGMPNNGGFDTFESLSLLPTQDAIA